MCRQNQALALVLIAFSAGLFLGSFFQMNFGLFLVVVGGIALGMWLLKKK